MYIKEEPCKELCSLDVDPIAELFDFIVAVLRHRFYAEMLKTNKTYRNRKRELSFAGAGWNENSKHQLDIAEMWLSNIGKNGLDFDNEMRETPQDAFLLWKYLTNNASRYAV